MNMHNLQTIFVSLVCLISSANGKYYSNNNKYYSDNSKYYSPSESSCRQFENKVYQLTVTFPDGKPLYAGLRLLPNRMFDEIFSIANGNNQAEVGANFALSTRVGYYKCLPNNQMSLTGYGYLYKTPDVPFLTDNGAVVMHDYRFKFDSTGRTLTGKVQFAVFKSGTNVFDTADAPVFPGPVGIVTGELLKFRTRFDLTLP